MSSLTTIFTPGTGYRGSSSPAAPFCFPPAVISLPHTFNFHRPQCHLAVVAPLAAVAGCATHKPSQHTVDILPEVQLCYLDNAHSPDAFCFSLLSPLLHAMNCWKAFCELSIISSGKIIQVNLYLFYSSICVDLALLL